ncbi:hypothetical protein [Methyloglobulus sp.]|uniref:hypothetical protein n=1 Tax=Methyloglobulus sp. TaxID=2518622 RepID=UPI0032B785D5
MIYPIELRGSQAMINEIVKNRIKIVSIFKWLLGLSALGFVIHFPDVIGHSIVWVVHTFYEATSFVLEHFLVHNFGFDKDLAQLIVFYFSVVVGLGTTVLFWRYWLKGYLLYKFYALQHQVIYYWHSKRTVEKIKLILIYSALMISTFILLIS